MAPRLAACLAAALAASARGAGAAASAGAAAPAAAALAASSAARGADAAAFAVSSAPLTGKPLAPHFVSFSIEVRDAPDVFLVGGRGGAPRASFAALMNFLRAAAGNATGPRVRVGGNSADESALVAPAAPLPAGTTYRLDARDFDAYAAAAAWRGAVTLDATMRYAGAQGAALAAAHAAAAAARLGPLLERVEVSNEADLFYEHGIRTPAYEYADYVREFAAVAAAASAALPRAPMLQGGAWAEAGPSARRWSLGNLSNYLATFGRNFTSMSVHRYPLAACSAHDDPTISALLADAAAEGLAAGLAPRAAAAAAAGIPLLVGEGNSVACGGTAGVSDVWAAALWALDALASAASVGVEGWFFHGMPRGAYAAVAYADTSTDAPPQVNPLFYGLAGFATFARSGAVLVAVNATRTTNALIKAWAAVDAAGAARVLVIHKDAGAAAPAAISIAPPAPRAGAAALVRGLPGAGGAAAAWDAEGMSFGGLSWRATTDGRPTGAPVVEPVAAGADGAFAFDLPPASFAILELPAA